jgi:hypothetical protein
MIVSLIDAFPLPLPSLRSAVRTASGPALAGEAFAATPLCRIDEVAGMPAGVSGLGPFICGDITLGTLWVAFQVAGCRHGKTRSNHTLTKVLAPNLDRSDRATIVLFASQADRAAPGFQQLRRIVLRRLAALPAAIRISTQLPLFERISPKNPDIEGYGVTVNRATVSSDHRCVFGLGGGPSAGGKRKSEDKGHAHARASWIKAAVVSTVSQGCNGSAVATMSVWIPSRRIHAATLTALDLLHRIRRSGERGVSADMGLSIMLVSHTR